MLNVGNDTKLRQGDKVTGIKCAVSEQDGVVTLKPDNTDEAAVVVSSGNTVTPQTVTASELADAPAGYVSRLIRINGMNVKDAEAGDVFEKGMAYTLTDGVTDITLELQDGCGLEEEEIPTEKINVTGISLAATKASIAPRSAEDVEREKAPVVHDTAQMPYSQSFDNENGDYDGTSSLPEGWQSTGTMPFVTANMTALPAPTGEYYMITGESSAIRDERAYTPFFDMKAA